MGGGSRFKFFFLNLPFRTNTVYFVKIRSELVFSIRFGQFSVTFRRELPIQGKKGGLIRAFITIYICSFNTNMLFFIKLMFSLFYSCRNFQKPHFFFKFEKQKLVEFHKKIQNLESTNLIKFKNKLNYEFKRFIIPKLIYIFILALKISW